MKVGSANVNVYLIIGCIFSLIGAVFTTIGVVVFMNLEAIQNSPNSQGDVRILPFVFGLLGVTFLCVGVPMLISALAKNSRIKKVIAEGNYVMAEVIGVSLDRSVRINGRHPYILECQYEDPYTGITHIFRSKHIFFNPQNKVGAPVMVWVDRNDYKYYYVNVEGILGDVQYH